MKSFAVFLELRLNKQLSKQSIETPMISNAITLIMTSLWWYRRSADNEAAHDTLLILVHIYNLEFVSAYGTIPLSEWPMRSHENTRHVKIRKTAFVVDQKHLNI